jgi:hypothetical protein
MEAMSLLAKARSTGLDVRVEGNELVVRGPRKAEKLAHQLLDYKDELMPLLAQPQPPDLDREASPKWGVRVWSDLLQESLWVVVDSEPPATFPSKHVMRLAPVAPDTEAWVPLTSSECPAEGTAAA